LDVERIVTTDVGKIRGPAVIRIGSGMVDRRAAGELRQRYWNGIDLRTIEIIYALAARTIGPLIRKVLVSPRGAAAVGLDHFEDSVDSQVFMGENRLAAVIGIALQEVGIDAAPTVK